jgi:putative hemolysin
VRAPGLAHERDDLAALARDCRLHRQPRHRPDVRLRLVSGTDPDAHAQALSLLAHTCLAPAERRPRLRGELGPDQAVTLERLARGSYDERRAMLRLPPLVKGYLRCGALFGDGAFIDHAFNTVDVCVVLPVEQISQRYATRFSVAA